MPVGGEARRRQGALEPDTHGVAVHLARRVGLAHTEAAGAQWDGAFGRCIRLLLKIIPGTRGCADVRAPRLFVAKAAAMQAIGQAREGRGRGRRRHKACECTRCVNKRE